MAAVNWLELNRIPQTLSDLDLLETIGVGTFGRVRLCRFKENPGPLLAIKMMKKSVLVRYRQVTHVKSEKDIALRVRAPFLTETRAVFQTEKMICMVSEYVAGGELFRRIRTEGRLSESAARFYASEVTLSLEYLHSLSILYRDIKPENILIDRSGHIKLVDFGFAKVVTNKTFTLCGTPEYLAPEVIERKGQTKAVDWWTLGVLVYEMLVGHPPFEDQNPYHLYEKIIRGSYEIPSYVSAAATDLIRGLLHPDSAKRLGDSTAEAGSVRNHVWFSGVDFEAVQQKAVTPPWRPSIVSDSDVSYYGKFPDSEEAEDSLCRMGGDPFTDF